MATRSEIIIKDYGTYEGQRYSFKLKLYHHHDGYPEGVGNFLITKVLPKLQQSNGHDCNSIANFLIKDKESIDDEFEITVYTHIDIQYKYIIDIPKKEILCYEGNYKKTPQGYKFKKDRKIDLIKLLTPIQSKELYR